MKQSCVIVLLLVAGCATPSGSYCQIADPPFIWQNLNEWNETPARIRTHLMRGNEKYETLCL